MRPLTGAALPRAQCVRRSGSAARAACGSSGRFAARFRRSSETSKDFVMGRKRLLHGLRVKDGFMRHPFDVQNNVQTSGLVRGPHLATGHPHDKHTTAYYGIAPSVIEKLCSLWRGSGLVAPPEDYSFVDLGAGMGRAMLVAARMPFREVIGV